MKSNSHKNKFGDITNKTKEAFRSKHSVISVFGNFYPHFERAGNTTTSLVYLIVRSGTISNVCVYGNRDSSVPKMMLGSVRIMRGWKQDDLLSMFRTLISMCLDDSKVFLFNIYPTCFGQRRVVNLFGLMMPVLLSILGKKHVIVYMHNFLESQEIGKLGYKVNKFSRFGIRTLEKMLAHATSVVTSLPSISSKMTLVLKENVNCLFIPYLEALFVHTFATVSRTLARQRDVPNILLFGSWGPQKDFLYLLQKLKELKRNHIKDFIITIAGSVNLAFPDQASELLNFVYEDDTFRLIKDPPEEEVSNIFMAADGIILPYNTTGGQSGVLQLAAFYELRVLSYENDQIKEQVELLDLKVDFFEREDINKLSKWINSLRVKDNISIDFNSKYEEALSRINSVILQH